MNRVFPDNLGFSPLGMHMQLAEIKHGRIAMIAIIGFALQEHILKIEVVEETPFFFLPTWNLIN